MTQHKDIRGILLEVGDLVATTRYGYHNLIAAEVIKINPKMVYVGMSNDHPHLPGDWKWVQNKYPAQLAIVEKYYNRTDIDL